MPLAGGRSDHALRQAFRAAHEAYLAQHANMVMARGPLVADDSEAAIGSVLLLDVPAMDTARTFMSAALPVAPIWWTIVSPT